MDIMLEEKEHFIHGNKELGIPGCEANGISEEVATVIYDQMIDFAKYAFNKSHAACYAAISMQTAYLKAHYPIEFFAGLLTSVVDNSDQLSKYLEECSKKGIKVLPPDINISSIVFEPVGDNALRYPFPSIKGVGLNIAKNIVDERLNGEYSGIVDILKRTNADRKCVESLILAGAFDTLGHTRRSMVEALSEIVKKVRDEKKNQFAGQMNLFEMIGEKANVDTYPELEEYPVLEKLEYEKNVTGYYISGHPLDSMENAIKSRNCSNIGTLHNEAPNRRVRIGGMIKNIRRLYTKAKGEPMCVLTLMDKTGEIGVVFFPKSYATEKDFLFDNGFVTIDGKYDIGRDGEPQVIADKALPLSDKTRTVWIQFPTENDFLRELNGLTSNISSHIGLDRVKIYIQSTKELKEMVYGFDGAKSENLDSLRTAYGNENVKITEK